MANTQAFDEVSGAVEILNAAGYEVEKDVHIHEEFIDGEDELVADITVILDEEGEA